MSVETRAATVAVRPPAWRPGLDGLRALAVVGVIAYHEPDVALAGGYLGVDLFFVLSGFLITGLLLDEHRRVGRIALGDFWARRARRLLPALAVVVAAAALWSWINGDLTRLAAMPGEIIAAGTYTSNWHEVASGGSYFGSFSALSPLRHLWSLALEEQFYLLWPVVVILCLRGRRATLFVVTVVSALASIVAMSVLAGPGDLSRAYYGTDTRVFAMLIGAGAAQLMWHRPPTSRRWSVAGLAAAAAVVVAIVAIPDTSRWMYHGGFAAFAAVASVAIVAASGHTTLTRVASHRWLMRIGAMSYALYLWHWPVRVFVTDDALGVAPNGWGAVAGVVVRAAATVGLAAASMWLLEARVRRSDLKLGHALVGWAAAIAVVAVLAGALAPRAGSVIDIAGAESNVVDFDALAVPTAANADLPVPPVTSADGAPVTAPVPAGAGKVLALGDSVAMTLAQGMQKLDPESVAVTNATKVGCGLLVAEKVLHDDRWDPLGTSCPDHDTVWAYAVTAVQPDVVTILTGAWDTQARDFGDGVIRIPGDEEFDRRYSEALGRTLTAVTSTGALVVLITPPCSRLLHDGVDRTDRDPARIGRLAELQRQAVAKFVPGPAGGVASFVDLNVAACGDGYLETFEGVDWRPDGVHFSPDGAAVASQWVLDHLAPDARAALRLG